MNNSIRMIKEMIDIRRARTPVKPGEIVKEPLIWVSAEMAAETGIAGLKADDQLIIDYRLTNNGQENVVADYAVYIKRPIEWPELGQGLKTS